MLNSLDIAIARHPTRVSRRRAGLRAAVKQKECEEEPGTARRWLRATSISSVAAETLRYTAFDDRDEQRRHTAMKENGACKAVAANKGH